MDRLLPDLSSLNGWLGKLLVPLGIKGAFSQWGVVIALKFTGLPFVVRTLQPVLENLERELEEAAATLGFGRARTFISVIAPLVFPPLLTGFALAFVRAIGEYGSVVFISGNLPNKPEIPSYLIVMRLEEYDYDGAMALAVVLLVISFVLLGVLNGLKLRVENGAARLNELTLPTHGVAEGQRLRIGFRPYAVQFSPHLGECHYRATIRHVYFLGVLMRLELIPPPDCSSAPASPRMSSRASGWRRATKSASRSGNTACCHATAIRCRPKFQTSTRQPRSARESEVRPFSRTGFGSVARVHLA